MATRSSKLDFWLRLQSEPRCGVMARKPSKLDFWRSLRSEPGEGLMASTAGLQGLYFHEKYVEKLALAALPAGLHKLVVGDVSLAR